MVFFAALVIVLVAAVFVLSFGGDWAISFSPTSIEDKIQSWGHWGVIGSIALMILHSFVPFPAEFLAIANGMVYGLVWGTVITWSGAMMGAFLAFALSRALGRPFVAMVVSQRNWHVIDKWAGEQGWQVVFLSRFLPIIAFNLVNYMAGLTSITWWTFGWTTGLGILPLTFLMVMMGDRANMLPWYLWAMLIVIGIAMWLALRFRRTTIARQRSGADGGSIKKG
jgi:uncharacterized membrane protein YdjX (TVP38/TMEM64 family)